MATEPSSAAALVAELPDWLKWGANLALILFAMVAGPLAVRAGRKGEQEHEAEVFDPADLLESSPIRRLVAAWETIADNARLQTEALKTISAIATLQAKALQSGFNEDDIHRDVHWRLTEARLARDDRAPVETRRR